MGRMTDDASDHRDPQLPPRGDRPKFAMDVDAGRYVNEGYACMSDNVKGGILELMPLEGAQVSHDKWNLIKSCRPRDLTYRSMNEAPWELTCIQMDLRHHIGRVAGTTYLDGRGGIRLVAATTVVGSISTIWSGWKRFGPTVDQRQPPQRKEAKWKSSSSGPWSPVEGTSCRALLTTLACRDPT